MPEREAADAPDPEDSWGGAALPPFTAFGWAGEGRLDLRVFDQDEWWVDIHGRGHRLEEMGALYRANVIGFLQEHREAYFIECLMLEAAKTFVEALAGRVTGELLVWAVGGTPMSDLSADEWLESTPLMRRLRRLS